MCDGMVTATAENVTTIDTVKHGAERAANSKWMDHAATFGFVAKGVVYAVIGIFALRLALGEGGALLGNEEAAREVKKQPFGQILLLVLGVGLACHALWRFAEAAFSPHHDDKPLKRIGKRIGAVGGGLLAAFLSINCFQTVAGTAGGDGKRGWLQRALQSDGGDWLIMAIGAGVIAFGISQLVKAYTVKFRKKLKTHEMSATEETWLIRISRFGIAARGVVLPVAGWLLIKAGLDANARQAIGTDAALREILQQTWGAVLLGIVAAGLIAYALYMGINARYRRAFA